MKVSDTVHPHNYTSPLNCNIDTSATGIGENAVSVNVKMCILVQIQTQNT